jgi:hypothetical protein
MLTFVSRAAAPEVTHVMGPSDPGAPEVAVSLMSRSSSDGRPAGERAPRVRELIGSER